MNLKKGNQVKVLVGKDKGKTGEIIEIIKKKDKLKIKSINMIKKHLKPTKQNKGGIIQKENYLHISNVKNIDNKSKSKKGDKKYDVNLKITMSLLIKKYKFGLCTFTAT